MQRIVWCAVPIVEYRTHYSLSSMAKNSFRFALFFVLAAATAKVSLRLAESHAVRMLSPSLGEFLDIGDVETVRWLINQDPELVNAKYKVRFVGHSEWGKVVPRQRNVCPLAIALWRDDDMPRFLLDQGADPNAMYDDCWTLMRASVECEDKQVMELLLEYGAGVDALDCEGITLLHVAAFDGLCEITQILIKNDAAVNATSSHGETPLIYALDRNAESWRTMEILLKAGADPNVREAWVGGATALDLCVDEKERSLLRRYGAKTSAELAVEKSATHTVSSPE